MRSRLPWQEPCLPSWAIGSCLLPNLAILFLGDFLSASQGSGVWPGKLCDCHNQLRNKYWPWEILISFKLFCSGLPMRSEFRHQLQ